MDKNVCPKCKNLGWVKVKFIDKEGVRREAFKKCDCRYNNISERIYSRMRIPRRYRDKELKNFEVLNKNLKAVLKKVDDYIEGESFKEGRGLFFLGLPGVGKTHLAVAVLKEFFRKRRIVGTFYDTNELLMNLKMSFDKYSSGGREILEEVINTPILVLDDLGAEKLSDWAREILHYIIVKRYNELLPIIITSNININLDKKENIFSESIEERLGSSIASRIYEMCDIVEIKGIDLRRAKTVLKDLKEKKKN